jgi:mannose-6-phosphate isomerase-like protein (cupin superfamily)
VPVYEPGRWLNPADRPEWCEISGAGRFAVPVDGARFERHRHDDHELWFISAGKAKVEVDGEHRYVQAGDIVLTRAGEFHDFVEVYEPVSGFFTEIGVPAGGRTGHLDPEPHEVPGLPVPDDFPVR